MYVMYTNVCKCLLDRIYVYQLGLRPSGSFERKLKLKTHNYSDAVKTKKYVFQTSERIRDLIVT